MSEAAAPERTADTIPRGLLVRLARDLIKFGTHEEFDCPGDTPESCGWYCDICKQHINDNDHAKGHKDDCTIAQLAKLLRASVRASSDKRKA
jgi:hypothetical protein